MGERAGLVQAGAPPPDSELTAGGACAGAADAARCAAAGALCELRGLEGGQRFCSRPGVLVAIGLYPIFTLEKQLLNMIGNLV